MWEGSHHLRKLEFPESVERALDQLRTHFVRETSSNIPGLGGMTEEMASQLVDDYIFTQPRGKAARLPFALIELQVLELIVSVFEGLAREKVKDTVVFNMFQALFGRAANVRERLHSLARLVSLAVSVKCGLLLDATALWMQMQGLQSSCIQIIMDTLIRDFCKQAPSSVESRVSPPGGDLTQLPELSQHFSCIFLTAVTNMYKFPGPVQSPENRPFYDHLLPLITVWISDHPHLCLVSLLQPQRSSTLWTSPTKPNTQTPIPGLVRWVTRTPLIAQTAASLQFSSTAVSDNYKNERRGPDQDLLWSRLHLGILQTLAVFPTLPGASQLEVVTLADMRKMTSELAGAVSRCPSGHGVLVTVVLDRMVQVLQIALATGAFRCSLADLKSICHCLPETKLRNILENQHLSNNPPAMHNAS